MRKLVYRGEIEGNAAKPKYEYCQRVKLPGLLRTFALNPRGKMV